MRRWAFYLSVALLAFGIGWFVVPKYFNSTNQDLVLVAVNDLTETPPKGEITKKLITAEDKSQNIDQELPEEFSTEPLFEKWIGGKEFNEEVISLRTMQPSNEYIPHSEYARIQLEDLNKDRKEEMIVFSQCIVTGNCRVEIAVKKEKGYKIILTANMIQIVKRQEVTKNEYYDLHLRTHNSAFSSYHQLFRFDGHEYRAQKCWWEDYENKDRNGNWHEVEKPIINFDKCGKYGYVN